MPIPAPTAPELIHTVIMGIGTVFFGLICLIILAMVMSAVVKRMGKSAAAPAAPTAPAAHAAPAAETGAIPNRQAMIAAIAAAIAEDLGTDISGIRILSVKKL